MTKKETFEQAYNDWLCACALYNGENFEKLYETIEDAHNYDGELFDFNFGTTCLTINKYDGKNKNKQGFGYVNEYSIEVWQGDNCLGNYNATQLMYLAEIEPHKFTMADALKVARADIYIGISSAISELEHQGFVCDSYYKEIAQSDEQNFDADNIQARNNLFKKLKITAFMQQAYDIVCK